MTLTVTQSIIIIALMVAGTAVTRFLPFMLFPGNRELPRYIGYLAKVLPYAAIGFLVVYCLKNVTPFAAPFGLPELVAILVIVVLHLWKRNTLLSVAGGTIAYMLLLHFVF